MRRRNLLVAIAGAMTALLTAVPSAHAALPPVKHVFIIVLENKSFDESFGANTPAPYLAKELTAKGQLLTHYYGTSHASLGNYISMVSGQAPNSVTQSDCNAGFQDVFPGTPAPDGQVIGQGCVYPRSVLTIADQLEAKGLSWKGYMQDMANSPTEPKTCRHPPIGDRDDTQSARQGDQYAVRHNPYMYFHSIIDEPATCNSNVIDLKLLPGDLASSATTASYSFITPNLCEDGHDAPCVDGRPGGLETSDAFLKEWVPRILASPAYRDGGVLLVTWDEGEIKEGESSAACCNQPTGPNTPMPGVLGPGGGRTGAIVLSPWTKPGTKNATPYNHYAMLRSVEDLFGLDHLGYAAQTGLRPFGDDVFNEAKTPAAATTTTPAGSTSCTTRAWVTRDARRRRVLHVRSAKAAPLRVRVGRRTVTKQLARCATARVVLPQRGRVAVRIGARGVGVKRR